MNKDIKGNINIFGGGAFGEGKENKPDGSEDSQRRLKNQRNEDWENQGDYIQEDPRFRIK